MLHPNVGETTIGELGGSASGRVTAIAGLFRQAGLPIVVSDNVLGHIWMKFVLNAAINPVSAITGLRPGEIARTEPARQLLGRVLDEILAVIATKGIRLPSPDPRGEILDHAWEATTAPLCSSMSRPAGGPRSIC